MAKNTRDTREAGTREERAQVWAERLARVGANPSAVLRGARDIGLDAAQMDS